MICAVYCAKERHRIPEDSALICLFLNRMRLRIRPLEIVSQHRDAVATNWALAKDIKVWNTGERPVEMLFLLPPIGEDWRKTWAQAIMAKMANHETVVFFHDGVRWRPAVSAKSSQIQ